ncbi:MAG: AAA family ATPase [Patescibacteria group bacterium]|nr:AAA family ATPase [Patescibacteria group bacterium]
MPQEASALEQEAFDRVLILGEPHIGKSTSVVASAAESFGTGYVINCGKKMGLVAAGRRSTKFKWDLVRDENQMEDAIKEARRGAKEGAYKWIVLDDFNLYASWLECALEDETRNAKGEPDGRHFWREYRKRLVNILVRCFDMRAHFYCITHYMETGGGLIKGQIEKAGYGVAPMFAGAARKEIPGMFADVVMMGLAPKDASARRFFINPVGVYGPSCLSAPGTHEIDADVGALHAAFKRGAKKSK